VASIAFLGPRGTNSEEAALEYGGRDADLRAFASIPALTSAVETGLADVAILPVENSLEGPIATTLDLLIHETPLTVCGEVVVPINHVLIGVEGSPIEGIRKVISHPQALGQCRKFLDRFLGNAEQVAWLSTAGAVQEAVAQNDPTVVAIGPERSHHLYGGTILARNIQDVRGNLTRFIALGTDAPAPTGTDKTMLGFTLPHDVPGVLVRAMTPFATGNIQLTKMESRPVKGWLGEYVFLIDFEGHRNDPDVAAVLAELETLTDSLKIFGSFPRYDTSRFRDLVASPGLLQDRRP
jgi:prephenate dehydratase